MTLNSIKEYAKRQTNITLSSIKKNHDINFTRYVNQRDFENYTLTLTILLLVIPDLSEDLDLI